MFESSEAVGGLSVRGDGVGDAGIFPFGIVGIGVLVEIVLGELIDEVVAAFLSRVGDFPLELDVAVGIVFVHDDEGDLGIFLKITVFGALGGSGEFEILSVKLVPERRHLDGSAGIVGTENQEVGLSEEVF